MYVCVSVLDCVLDVMHVDADGFWFNFQERSSSTQASPLVCQQDEYLFISHGRATLTDHLVRGENGSGEHCDREFFPSPFSTADIGNLGVWLILLSNISIMIVRCLSYLLF